MIWLVSWLVGLIFFSILFAVRLPQGLKIYKETQGPTDEVYNKVSNVAYVASGIFTVVWPISLTALFLLMIAAK